MAFKGRSVIYQRRLTGTITQGRSLQLTTECDNRQEERSRLKQKTNRVSGGSAREQEENRKKGSEIRGKEPDCAFFPTRTKGEIAALSLPAASMLSLGGVWLRQRAAHGH